MLGMRFLGLGMGDGLVGSHLALGSSHIDRSGGTAVLPLGKGVREKDSLILPF